MKQTGKLDNACGLIAMMHGVLNNGEGARCCFLCSFWRWRPQQSRYSFVVAVGVDAGSPLAQYFDANKAATPEERASSLESFKENTFLSPPPCVSHMRS